MTSPAPFPVADEMTQMNVGAGSSERVLYLADYSDDCRTQSVERLLEQCLEDVRAVAPEDPMRPTRAVVVIRYTDGDLGETQVQAAGVDLVGLVGMLALGSAAVSRPREVDD